jgi:hypothetical protein
MRELVQSPPKKLIMIIDVYLLDLVDHSWTMALNFVDMVLSQFNLIKGLKKGHFHHDTHIKTFHHHTHVEFALGRWES